jgi:hypothetical protein
MKRKCCINRTLQQTSTQRHHLRKHPGLDLVQPTPACQRLINRIHHPFQVLPSLDPSLLRQHHHDTSMRGNRQTSSTPGNVFSMEAFQSQVTVNLLSKHPASVGGKTVTPFVGIATMNDSQNTGDARGYQFDEVDDAVVAITGQLIVKVLESSLLNTAAGEAVFAIAKVFAELPDSTGDLYASLSLVGPRRSFDDREIYHHWSIEVEGEEIRVGAGGQFYRPSTGGDSFTSFRWAASPGFETECQDFGPSLQIVDDAKPFAAEIAELNLAEPGFSVSVTLDGEDIDVDDEIDDDQLEEDEFNESELPSDEFAVCLWAFLDADVQLIYALAGRAYCLSGDDESKLATLKELSRYDFRSVDRSRVPDRFRVNGSDGTEMQGFTTPQAVFDSAAILFSELFEEIEARLPPLADFVHDKQKPQRLPEDPLGVRTIVYEDAHGNCRAIVDEEDKTWLRHQMR